MTHQDYSDVTTSGLGQTQSRDRDYRGALPPEDRALVVRLLRRPPGARAPVPRQAVTARLEVERLCDRFTNLGAILAAEDEELARIGLSPQAVADLRSAAALAERLARCLASREPVLSSWSVLMDYLRVALAHQPREQFRALFLDCQNRLLSDELVTYGSVDHAPVYPREVVREALALSASAMILVHNHPSGDPTPSRADIEMTRKIVEAAAVFGIRVHDHVVVGRSGTASFRALGLS